MQALKHKNSYMESTEHVEHVDSIELQPLNTQLHKACAVFLQTASSLVSTAFIFAIL